MSEPVITPEQIDNIQNSISVKIQIVGYPAPGFGVPDDNHVGARILLTHLTAALDAAGLLTGTPGGVGPLNRSFFTFHVSDLNAAFKILLGALSRASLDYFSRIYRFDISEGVLRCMYPEGGNVADVKAYFEEIDSASKETELYLEKLGAFIKSGKPIPPLGETGNQDNDQ